MTNNIKKSPSVGKSAGDAAAQHLVRRALKKKRLIIKPFLFGMALSAYRFASTLCAALLASYLFNSISGSA